MLEEGDVLTRKRHIEEVAVYFPSVVIAAKVTPLQLNIGQVPLVVPLDHIPAVGIAGRPDQAGQGYNTSWPACKLDQGQARLGRLYLLVHA